MPINNLSQCVIQCSLWFLLRFSSTSISLIAIVLLLIKLEQRKHISINLIKVKLIFVPIHDAMVAFGKSLLIVNNSPSFETKVLHSIPIAACIVDVVNVSCVKLACSTSKVLLLSRRFFSRSFTPKHCSKLLDWYSEVLSNTLMSKNAFQPVIQKLLALTSNLAPSFVFAVGGTRVLSVTGCELVRWQDSNKVFLTIHL